jgi:1,4-dihydroxy-2-naphthoate octaprenyltransferase
VQHITWEPLIASIPISLLICSVLFINEFPDYKADKLTSKKTLVVRLGRAKAIYVYSALVLTAYVIILLNILANISPIYTLIALIPFPLSIKAISLALKFHSTPSKLVPVNALTIIIHSLTSLFLSIGYIINRLEIINLYFFFILGIILISIFLTFSFYTKKNSTIKQVTLEKGISYE